MATTSVESQRLISLSLGKIAQSRSQKGGINLHKNLLVATVLHKARTACMMEYQTLQRQRQLQYQQQQQQLQQQKEFEQKQEQARSAALSLAAFNTAQEASEQQQQNNLIPTCVREMEEEEEETFDSVTPSAAGAASAPVPHETNLGHAHPASSPSPASALVPSSVTELELGQHADFCNKENAPPCQGASSAAEELDTPYCEDEAAAQVVPQSTCSAAGAASPLDHLAAATQLAEDAAGPPTWCAEGKSRSCQTSAGPTCNVLKRQREDNSGAVTPSDQECPPTHKKARLVACRRDSCSSRNCGSNNNHTVLDAMATDSSQISNLVSIFNSGFTGLCAAQDSTHSDDYTSSLSCDSGQYTTLTPVQPDSPSLAAYSRKMADSSSLSCSSALGRLDTLPSPVGLVLSV